MGKKKSRKNKAGAQEKTEKISAEKNNKGPVNYKIISFLIIALFSLIIYSNSFSSEFQFDDDIAIVNNPGIKNLENFSHFSDWFSAKAIISGRPLSNFSLALNYSIHGLNVTGYHVINLIIHIIAGFLVYILTNLLFSLWEPASGLTEKKEYISIAAALLFVSHPLQTQAVTYIVQRMTSMAAMFYLLSIILYIKGRTLHIEGKINPKVILLYISAFLTGFLALMSKQNAVTFPAAMVLTEFCFIRDKNKRAYKKYLAGALAFFIVFFLLIILTGSLPSESESISRFDYFITQFRVIFKYIQLLFLPVNQRVDYDFIASKSIPDLKVIGSFLLLCSLLVYGIFSFRKNRTIAFGIFWFFLTLSVESSIIPIRDIIFEHRLYLPMLGFVLVIISLLNRLFNKKNVFYFRLILIFLFLVYGIATFNRNSLWKTRETLWADNLKKSPGNPRTYLNVGNSFLLKGDYDNALKYVNMALKIQPDYTEAISNLAAIWYSKGDLNKSEEYYERILKLKPDDIETLHNLGAVNRLQGDFEKSLMYFNRVLELRSDYDRTLNNLGTLLYQKGDIEKAIKYYSRAVKINPKNPRYLNDLGSAFYKKDMAASIKYIEMALEIKPDYPDALANLALLYMIKGNKDKARNYCQKALSLKPDHAQALKIKAAMDRP